MRSHADTNAAASRRGSSKSTRPRGFSFTSLHSQAVSGDDGDATDTDEMLGQVEEDVCFPVSLSGELYELDELTTHRTNSVSEELDSLFRESFLDDRFPRKTVKVNTEEDGKQSPDDEGKDDKKAEQDKLYEVEDRMIGEDEYSHDCDDDIGVGVCGDEATVAPSQRFSFFSAGLESTIHATELALLADETGSFASLFKPENGSFFLDCFRPTDVEMRALSRAFGIHPLTTEDIQTEDSREKFEMFKNYFFVAYHTFNEEDPINFYILVFREGVISFHFEPVTHCRNVRRRMRQLREFVNFSPEWIAYALIDDITDSFAPEIRAIEHETDFIEEAVYLDHEGHTEMSTLLKRIGEGRKHTMHILRMVSGKPDVVRSFIKRLDERDNGAEMALYLGDVLDHLVTMWQNLSNFEKIFGRTHFNYMGLLQMEFVDATNTMTGVLGKVTLLGTILLPMNLVTGLWGMNVNVPGQDMPTLRWFFVILGCILFVIVSLCASGYFYFKYIVRPSNFRTHP